jgi:hypothetical protein
MTQQTTPNAVMHTFTKNLVATSKFQAPEGCDEASSILRTQQRSTLLYTIQSPGRPVARDLCTPVLLTYTQKENIQKISYADIVSVHLSVT